MTIRPKIGPNDPTGSLEKSGGHIWSILGMEVTLGLFYVLGSHWGHTFRALGSLWVQSGSGGHFSSIFGLGVTFD